MNEMNFDSLKHIKAPREWLEKAAAVPEISVKKPPFPLYRFAAVAGVVLVSVIGLMMYGLFGKNDAPIAIHNGRADETFITAETTGDPSDNSRIMRDPAVLPTKEGLEPTVLSGQSAASSVTSPVDETTSSVQDSTIRPNVPTEGSQPVNVVPTAAPVTDPLAPSRPSVRPTTPPEPTSPPPTQEPTDPYNPPGDCEIYGMFRLSEKDPGSGYAVATDVAVFCRLYDENGAIVGSSGLFSPQREAKILSKYDDGIVIGYYNPAEKGLLLSEGAYEVVFYDGFGNELYRDVKFVF